MHQRSSFYSTLPSSGCGRLARPHLVAVGTVSVERDPERRASFSHGVIRFVVARETDDA